jgi:hypothetical protein
LAPGGTKVSRWEASADDGVDASPAGVDVGKGRVVKPCYLVVPQGAPAGTATAVVIRHAGGEWLGSDGRRSMPP